MIELRHLRYFVAAAEELNFTRAAERVHIDQTPLSRSVRELEEYFGVQLFVRAPRRLRLTPAGERLLDEARKIFIRIERTTRIVQSTGKLYKAPLRVGVADGIAQPMLSDCFIRWKSVAPEIPLELKEMRARELALVYAARGDAAKATAYLRQAVNQTWLFTEQDMRLDPFLDKVRASPEFAALLADLPKQPAPVVPVPR